MFRDSLILSSASCPTRQVKLSNSWHCGPRPGVVRYRPVHIVFPTDLPGSIRTFLARYIRSVEQLEILLLFGRAPTSQWSSKKVYDTILSTPHSVDRWLEEMTRTGLLEKTTEPPGHYRCSTNEELLGQITLLAELYRISPVRVIEAIYRRDTIAAQSFADAFKLKNTDQSP